MNGLGPASLAPDQADTLLDGAMLAARHSFTEMKKVEHDFDPERFFVMALREPHKRGLSIHIMLNWLDPVHTIIPVYKQLRSRLPAAERNERLRRRRRRAGPPPMTHKLHGERGAGSGSV